MSERIIAGAGAFHYSVEHVWNRYDTGCPVDYSECAALGLTVVPIERCQAVVFCSFGNVFKIIMVRFFDRFVGERMAYRSIFAKNHRIAFINEICFKQPEKIVDIIFLVIVVGSVEAFAVAPGT